jgi:ABC-type uncharacterized transport system involved in gliding motility auxiliary subunit
VTNVNRRSTLGGGLLLACTLLFIGLTILFGQLLRGWRVDLTENGLYTIAPGTERILKGLDEPLNLYFYFSEKTASELPAVRTYGARVRDFLEELAARSGGKLRLAVVDPQPFSEDEDRAAELGVRGAPVGSSGRQLYFGLAATNSTDGRAAIEFFDPGKEEFLEYDVVKLIYQLANPKKPAVAWLSSLPMTPTFDPMSGGMREPSMIYMQAEQLFDLRPLSPGATSIDADVDLLVMVHPKHLSPQLQFAIDQFALRGGRILLFVDPLAEADESGADPQNPMAAAMAQKSSDPGPLLAAWGVEFNPRQVVGDAERALSVGMREGAAPVRHLGILGLDDSSFNRADVIASGLSSVNVATSGFLNPAKGATTKFEPILRSSALAAPLPVERFQMLFDPANLLDGFKPTGERYAIAARVTGNVKTAFPSGPPAGGTQPAGGEALKASSKPLNLIVFADTDLLADFLWVRQQSFFGQRIAQAWAHNGDLVMNALDNLAGSSDLISVRGRATFTRPFGRVDALRRQAEDHFRATEQQLEQSLRDTEAKLAELESKRSDQSSLILTPEQAQEIERFQAEKLSIRKQLRDVRLGLDQEISRLGNLLKVLNIVVAPLVFAVVALAVVRWRRRKRTTIAVPAAGTAA